MPTLVFGRSGMMGGLQPRARVFLHLICRNCQRSIDIGGRARL